MDESASAGHAPSELTTRLHLLDVTLHDLERVRQRLEDTEQRFGRIMRDSASLLEALGRLDEQRAGSVAALNARLTSLIDDSNRRIESFERGVSHEWTVLRELYEAPLDDLKRQAQELRSACLEVTRALGPAHPTGAGSYDSLAARTEATPATPVSGEPWSLGEVARLHQRVRESPAGERMGSGPAAALGLADPSGTAPPAQVGGLLGLETPPLSLPAAPITAHHAAEPLDPRPSGTRTWRVVLAFSFLVLLVAAGFGIYTSRLWERIGQLEARTAEASQRITQAEQQVVEVQKAAEQRVGDLQQAAVRAQRVSEILAAPDLLRIDLGPTARGGGAYAQVLWSRSRGLVASASRLPRTRPGRVYQLWVLNDEAPASAGVFELDGAGRGSLIIGEPLTFPKRLGFVVTGEPEGGSPAPTGLVYLRERQ
jgi:hypothetical protein